MERFALRGRLLLPDGLVPGAVVVDESSITAVLRAPDDDALAVPTFQAAIVAPGFIDLQVNGGYGFAVGHDVEALCGLAMRLPETGVTGFLPTIVTSPPDFYPAAYATFERSRQTRGARPLGLHLEGPLLSPERPGAHRRDLIAAATPTMIAGMLDNEATRLVTLAPEREGATDIIRGCRERGVVVSLGHTDASFDVFEAGVDAGATMATHLYNAMSPFHHRAPNVVGGSLVDDRVTVGLIADGIHSHPWSLELAVRTKGAQRIALVSDMVSAAGMPDGEYDFGGRTVIRRGSTVRLSDGTLAGSTLTMDQAVRAMVHWTSADVADALRMASEVPAGVLGLEKTGRLEPGLDADLVLLDADLHVEATLVKGQWLYRRDGA